MSEKERGIRQRYLFAAILAGLLNGGAQKNCWTDAAPKRESKWRRHGMRGSIRQ